jgi:hypothetical protein
MNKSYLLSILLSAVVFSAGCAKRVTPAVNVDACSLLTNEEVASIQGTKISVSKGSSSSGAGMQVSQCVWGSIEPNKSVGIAVSQIEPSDPSRQSPNDFWEKTFARFRKGEEKEERESEKRKKESLGEKNREEDEDAVIPPIKVEGVGAEAFWTPSRVGGALYVQKKARDAFIRISVGGPGSTQEKIEKSKRLALKALPRL